MATPNVSSVETNFPRLCERLCSFPAQNRWWYTHRLFRKRSIYFSVFASITASNYHPPPSPARRAFLSPTFSITRCLSDSFSSLHSLSLSLPLLVSFSVFFSMSLFPSLLRERALLSTSPLPPVLTWAMMNVALASQIDNTQRSHGLILGYNLHHWSNSASSLIIRTTIKRKGGNKNTFKSSACLVCWKL